MLPSDTPAEDWGLYFHDTFMTHRAKGVGLIKVRNNDDASGKNLKFYAISTKGKASDKGVKVNASDLNIYWPRPGAYNLPEFDTAVFVGRSAQRHMKRSASYDHYFITWSCIPLPMGGIVPYIVAHPRYTSITQFNKRMDNIVARAISNRVILLKSPGENTSVIYMSEMVGNLNRLNKFIPSMEFDSRTRRITEHLHDIGVTV